MLRVQLTSTPTPSESFGEVTHQYTDTLCTTQKLTNSQIHCYRTLPFSVNMIQQNKEESLTDLETAADLTKESQAKLAKAKSRGLPCTLVSINSEKTWDEIKDLFRLKLCNANIYTYTSCFIDIQQWEKESLEAYVH